ncbi:MAG: hypothetical protein AAF503_16100 [Pseudomonadota bacterium]
MDEIQGLRPVGPGHQFAFYGDSCSGVPGALHARKLAQVNAVVQRLDPAPELIIFPGDEVIGLVPDEAGLRAQWAHFFDVEMAWQRQAGIAMYHCTGNHTTYDRMSERVFAEVMAHLPRNGPPDQPGLSYFVREGDLLFVFVNTLWSGLGGEGHLELTWLDQTLTRHADAAWTFVVGHHPAFAVNGYAGTYQRTIGDEYVAPFWEILTRHRVLAYLCSHILAFDVQCHQGVLQITSAGAGTAHRMPEGVEYLHCVQMAVDRQGLRYQVLDEDGGLRERLSWPPGEIETFVPLAAGQNAAPWRGGQGPGRAVQFKLSGSLASTPARQTILAALEDDGRCPLWIGLVGRDQQLTIVLQPETGRSPHQWLGPSLAGAETFDLEIVIEPDMGPGGFLWRDSGSTIWTGLHGQSAWGAGRLDWPDRLCVGARTGTADEMRFAGAALSVEIAVH